jgi:hypothetical protein
MAHLCPALPPRLALTAGDYTELDILDTLERGLSDAYTLFHSVEWSRVLGDMDQRGEVDIVVVNQEGDVLLIEVKAGEVEFRPDGFFKTYSKRPKNVTAQVRRQFSALGSRLQDAGLLVQLRHVLVLPDVRVLTDTAQWPRDRIIDSEGITKIVSTVTGLLGPGVSDGQTSGRVLAFFENRFRVQPDVSALAGRLSQATTRLSAGLATWVPRIDSPSGVIRIVGTAGSGKTQLALRLLRDADAAGQKAAYLCFNRALADHMARVAPVRSPAETFHEFALRVARRSGSAIEFADPATFQTLAEHCVSAVAAAAPDLDLLVIDEVQDLQPEWVQALLTRLRPEGRAVLMEDPDQQLYADREAFEVDGAVTVTSHENFRSPKALVRLINLLRLVKIDIEALGPFEGEPPEPIVYDQEDQVVARTVDAVERCIRRGFDIGDVAVVSLRGRERSLLQRLDHLGPWTVRRFTGRYDECGGALWTEGALLVDSVRRFKGQAAQAVVLTECDVTELDPLSRRLLFVGLTRARFHLEWVVSRRTEHTLTLALAN